MKKADMVAQGSVKSLDGKNGGENPRSASGQGFPRQDHVDAINQMFAEFELAYHNQYHKAYADEGSLTMAKKYWLNRLSRFAPELILKAARDVVQSQPWLPTLATVLEACENGMGLYGLPAPREAYREACCAPSPKTEHAWSHPAVYLAARETGWFELATRPEGSIFPRFEYNYRLLVNRVLEGEDLDIDLPPPLPEKTAHELSPEENREKLKELRKNLKL